MSDRIKDRVAIVTGASRGIGRATAIALNNGGAHVVLAARDTALLEQLRDELGGQTLAVTTDVTDSGAIERLVARTIDRFGRVEILVNNAGIGLNGIVAELALDDVRRVFEVNVYGALGCMQACIPHMRRQGFGHIVNVSSILGKRAVPQTAGYAATKFALHALSDGLRLEETDHGIVVTVVCPGSTDTDFRANELRSGSVLVEDRPRVNLVGPEKVATAIVRGIVRRKREVMVTAFTKFLATMERVSPATVDFALKRAYQKK